MGCEWWDDQMMLSYTRFLGLMNACRLSRIHNALIALDKKRGNPTKKDRKK
jgi:1,6-anhydro-N-acetylmuramate kinase